MFVFVRFSSLSLSLTHSHLIISRFSLSLPPLTAQAIAVQQSNDRHNTTECSHWIDSVLFTLFFADSFLLLSLSIIISVVLVSFLFVLYCSLCRNRFSFSYRLTDENIRKASVCFLVSLSLFTCVVWRERERERAVSECNR